MKPRRLSTALAAILAANSAQAVDFYWDGNTGNWSATTDWSTAADGLTDPGAIPNSTTTADLFFNITSKNTASSDISNGNAVRNARSLTFNTSGNTGMRAGGSSAAASTLTIGAGGITVDAGTVTLGQTPASYGTLTVALGADQIWTNNSAGTLTVAGAVTGASRNLTKAGTGTVRLNGANTYSGTTSITGGKLQIANYDGLDNTSSITVSGNGSIELLVVGSGNTTNSINKSLSLFGTLNTAGGTSANTLDQTWAGAVTLTGNSTFTGHGNGALLFTNSVDLGANQLTFQTDGSRANSISGNITGTGGSLVKTSTSSLTLSGTNDYTGGTTISGGRLQFTKLVSMPATGNVAVNAATLAVNVGGTGEWTAGTSGNGTIGGLLAGLGGQSGSTLSFTGAVTLGLDTTNATPTTQTFSGNIADVGTSLGIQKLGTNTLILSGTNTYTGATTVSGGTLRFENGSAASTSSALSIGSSTLQLATDTAFSQGAGTSLSIAGGTLVSDRATPGAGLTHVFAGNMAFSHATHNFTKGTNVTSGDAAIQVASVSCASGSGGTATFNPTTANLIIVGGVNGANTGTSTYALGGSAAANSIGGNITLGTRTTINVSKTGNSVWTLSGDNNTDGTEGLNGTTTVTGGALIATTQAALPNTKASSLPSYARVTFNGGAIVARVGGAGWTTTEVDSLLSGATKTSGQLGIDTTNGDLTQWTPFVGGTGNNFDTLGLAKLGTGKLTLNSTGNTYTGTTLVSQGTLEMTVDHSLSGGLTFGFANGTTSATGTLDLNNVNATFGGNLQVSGNSATPL